MNHLLARKVEVSIKLRASHILYINYSLSDLFCVVADRFLFHLALHQLYS